MNTVGPLVGFYETFLLLIECIERDEVHGPVVSALSVLTWKLSKVRKGQSADGWPKFISRVSGGTWSCWSQLHLQSLAPTPVSRRVDVKLASGRKNSCRIFITTWWKICCTDFSGLRVAKIFVHRVLNNFSNSTLYISEFRYRFILGLRSDIFVTRAAGLKGILSRNVTGSASAH
jgi:hypothetical protein